MARVVLTAVLAVLAACRAAPPGADAQRPPLEISPLVALVLAPGPGPGPVRVISVTVRLGPDDDGELDIVPAGPSGAAGLVELVLDWQDFRGDGPVSSGRSEQRLLPWGGEARATRAQPCERRFEIELGPVEGVLARRVAVEGRLIGLDLVRPEGHSGARLIALSRTSLESVAPAPPGLLEEHLQSGRADGIFLAAAGAPPAWREHVLDGLVRALPSSRGAAREAIFAALLWRTGQTHGRDVQRWSAWWSEERRKPGR